MGSCCRKFVKCITCGYCCKGPYGYCCKGTCGYCYTDSTDAKNREAFDDVTIPLNNENECDQNIEKGHELQKPKLANAYVQTDTVKDQTVLKQSYVSNIHMTASHSSQTTKQTQSSQQTSQTSTADTLQQTDVSKVHLATNDTSQQTSITSMANSFQQTDASKLHFTTRDIAQQTNQNQLIESSQQTSKTLIADTLQQTDVSKVHFTTNDTLQQTDKPLIADFFQQTDVSKVHLTTSDAAQQTKQIQSLEFSQQTNKMSLADSPQQTDISKVHFITSDTSQQTQQKPSIESSQQTSQTSTADTLQQTDVSKVHLATNDTSQQTSITSMTDSFQQTDVSKVHLTTSNIAQQTKQIKSFEFSQQTNKMSLADSLQQTDISKVHSTTTNVSQQTQQIQSIESSQQTSKTMTADSPQQTDISKVHLPTSDTSQQTKQIQSIESSQKNSKTSTVDFLQQTDFIKGHLTTGDNSQQTKRMQFKGTTQQAMNREMRKNDETTIFEETSDSTDESDFETVNDEEIEDIARTKAEYDETYRKGGLGGLYDKINEKLNKWQNVAIRFAIIGESGTGKSSFINAMLGLSAYDKGAAKIGAEETTLVCTEYKHPRHGSTYFVDCPGVGTTKFPKSTYLETIRFDAYDFFILLTNSRFKENELWLAKEIEKTKRAFYFVRTKIDNDLQRVQKPNKVIADIRLNTTQYLVENGFNDVSFFLVNCYDPQMLDFVSLNMQMIKDIPKIKKEALVFTLTPSSSAIIADKYAYLSSRIKYVAVAASLGSLVPIPGVGIACEVGVLLREVKTYKSQFGTDEKTMKEVAEKLSISVDILYEESEMKTHVIYGTASQSMLLTLCAELFASEVAENFVKYIPIIGSFIAATTSVPVCMHALHKLLKLCRAEAERTLNVFQQRMRSSAV